MTLDEFTEMVVKMVNKKLLSTYKNGNHYVAMFEDGTKVKQTIDENDKYFTYNFPENFDLKINNKCDQLCKYCHENSTPNGKTRSLIELIGTSWYKSLHSGTEIAIGGGNVFESEDLLSFLTENKRKGLISNITVNQGHFHKNFDTIKYYIENDLVHGVGVSLLDSSDEVFIKDLEHLKELNLANNVVIHTIAGILKEKDFNFLKGKKVLVLGYKDFRRGHTYLSDMVKDNIKWLKDHLNRLSSITKLLSFDCLGIEQLDPKNTLNIKDNDWNILFQGSDTDVMDDKGNITCSTMYIDWSENKCARMSTATLDQRFDIDNENDTIEDLFKKSIQGW